MICPKCGVTVQDDRQSCFNCGAYIPQASQRSFEDDYWRDDYDQSSSTYESSKSSMIPEKKYENIKFIIPILIVIIIFTALGLYIFLNPSSDTTPKEKSPELEIEDLEGGIVMFSGSCSYPVTITLETNVERKNYDWTFNDLNVGRSGTQTFNIVVDEETNTIGVGVKYNGKLHDDNFLILGKNTIG